MLSLNAVTPGGIRRILRLWPLLLPLLTSCAAHTVNWTVSTPPKLAGSRVIVWEPDIDVYRVGSGGLPERDGTASTAAKETLRSALEKELSERGLKPLPTPAFPPDSRLAAERQQYVLLADAVLWSVPVSALLPTKKGKFEWSLGPGASVLGQGSDAEYVLFASVQDVRVAAFRRFVEGAIGRHTRERPRGFAMLVDVRSGDVAWETFFSLEDRPTSELQDPQGALATAQTILSRLPQ